RRLNWRFNAPERRWNLTPSLPDLAPAGRKNGLLRRKSSSQCGMRIPLTSLCIQRGKIRLDLRDPAAAACIEAIRLGERPPARQRRFQILAPALGFQLAEPQERND